MSLSLSDKPLIAKPLKREFQGLLFVEGLARAVSANSRLCVLPARRPGRRGDGLELGCVADGSERAQPALHVERARDGTA